ncbi:PDZ domain-containing protein [Bacillus sp. Marseille-P3661]|uniref:PDZ domain-containing protein n=1 Tax=Bacillus sp. Marseille-P3661 TaxID=1936234 RepID=UPI0021554105|nr:PDZ domain-containing protein [Bacillus sp. Marseille-P3661]
MDNNLGYKYRLTKDGDEMTYTWILDVLVGVGRYFLNPLVYIVFLFSFILGYRRVKRERKDFNIRIFHAFIGWRELIWPSIVTGLVISVITLGLGLLLPYGFTVLTGAISVLFLCLLRPRLLSPAYVLGFAILVSLFLPMVDVNQPIFVQWLEDIGNTSFLVMAIIMSLLLVAEGLLILKRGSNLTTPRLKKSKRGKLVGIHETQKLWMAPVFFLIPGDAITSIWEWWPVIATSNQSYTVMLVPFGIGFYQQIQSSLPKMAIQATGRRVLGLSMIVLTLTVAAYWYPILAVGAAVVALIGREWITIRQRSADEDQVSFFANRDTGMVILGVIPGSPADRMSLQIGEVVTKVNGQVVRSEKEFYEALQVNRAFCKLEVLDYNGEVRFANRSLYDGEHHELGLLFVHDDNQWTTEAV